jgi:hypothetical protein
MEGQMPKAVQGAGEVLQIIARAEADDRAIHISSKGKISVASGWRNYLVHIKSKFSGTDLKQVSHLAAKEFFISLLQEETEAGNPYGAEHWKTLRERVPALRWRADSADAFDTLAVMEQLQQAYTKVNAEQFTKDAAKRLQSLTGLSGNQSEAVPATHSATNGHVTRFKTQAALELYTSHCSYSNNQTLFHYFDAIQPYPKLRKKIDAEYDKLLAQNLEELEKAYLDAPEQGNGLEITSDLMRALLVTATRTARAGGPISRPL